MPEEQIEEQQAVETAAPADEQGEIVATESETAQTEPTPEEKQANAVQKRIDKLTRQKNDAAREAEYWRQQALKPRETPAASKETAKDDAEPKEEDFEGNAAGYVKAVARWEARQERIEANRVEEERNAKRHEERTLEESKTRARKDVEAFKATTPDFDDVMEEAHFNTSELMNSEIRDADSPAAVLYFLAKNPLEGNRLAEITDAKKMAKEMAKIEARIASAPAAAAQEPITSTLKPIKPVATSRQLVTKPAAEMSDQEYFDSRRAKGTY